MAMLDRAGFLKENEAKPSAASQWVPGLRSALRGRRGRQRLEIGGEGKLEASIDSNSCWLIRVLSGGTTLALRTCFDAQGLHNLQVRQLSETHAELSVTGGCGRYTIVVDYVANEVPVLRTRTRFTASQDVRFVAWPRDLLILASRLTTASKGAIYAEQSGPTSGLVWFSATAPGRGTFLYFQNLTSLSEYCEVAEADPCGSVAAEWPEVGFALPAANKPLPAGKDFILSDAFLTLGDELPSNEAQSADWFLSHLAAIYPRLQKPDRTTYDWPHAATRTLSVIARSKECRRRVRGYRYLNAYVGSKEKPPESMVQLAVLIPLLDYEGWSGRPTKLSRLLLSSFPNFFDKKLKAVVRWLPGEHFGDGADSEEESHERMDSWYYLHTLLNVTRLAEQKHDGVMDFLEPSLNHAIKVAHHFNYHWPVFYRLPSLAVIKAETKPGEGGEYDVAGLYAHVMLQAFELTKEKRYLKEAEAAARHIKGKAFTLLYQTNNTMMSAIALARLWRLTDNRTYRDLSLVCMANVVARMWIWNAKFGHSKAYDTFLGVAPLQDAPYLAAYEEHEFLGSAISYLKEAGEDVHPALSVLIPEFMKYLLHRARFYFPEELPEDAVCEKPKEGELRRDLLIPLEDLYAGRKQAGQVGQEVYGAAAAFILTTAAYINRRELPFLIRSEYPVLDFEFQKAAAGRGEIRFRLAGNHNYTCRLAVIAKSKAAPVIARVFEIGAKGESPVTTRSAREGYELKGETRYRIEWAIRGKGRSRKRS
jgi:hypothetical protein